MRPSTPPLEVEPSLPRPRSVFISPLPQMDIPLPLAYNVWLPIAASGNPPVIDTDASCFFNDKALALFHLIKNDPRQQRTQLTCNKALVVAAQKRAQGLANGDPWSHTDGQGVTPNQYARAAGCKLPDSYAAVGNNIESLTAGMPDAVLALWHLTNNDAVLHRRHVLAETEFYREQTQIGVGFAQGSNTYQYYWVFMSSVCQ